MEEDAKIVVPMELVMSSLEVVEAITAVDRLNDSVDESKDIAVLAMDESRDVVALATDDSRDSVEVIISVVIVAVIDAKLSSVLN